MALALKVARDLLLSFIVFRSSVVILVFSFEFLISDWNMPQMTGIELLRKVRSSEEFGDLPFLMVTAEAQQENIIEAVQAKVSNYVVKPFTAEIMKQKIDKIFP